MKVKYISESEIKPMPPVAKIVFSTSGNSPYAALYAQTDGYREIVEDTPPAYDPETHLAPTSYYEDDGTVIHKRWHEPAPLPTEAAE